MKKKGGTAGIPRPSGERGSPTGNGLLNDQVSFHHFYIHMSMNLGNPCLFVVTVMGDEIFCL